MYLSKYSILFRIKVLLTLLGVILFILMTTIFAINHNDGLRLDYRGWILIIGISFAFLLIPLVFLLIYRPLTRNLDQGMKYLKAGDFDASKPEELDSSFSSLLEQARIVTRSRNNAIMLKQQAEISALQSQINPHFLYNTLEAIRSEALLENQKIIAEMTEALSAFFRYSISYKSPIVPLSSELKNVKDYLSIQMYRFQDKIKYSISYEDLNDQDQIMQAVLPIMTLQPIIENSIFHGLEMKVGQGDIIIKIRCTEKRLIINVVDNGIGMDENQLEQIRSRLYNHELPLRNRNQSGQRSGFAIYNVNRRLKLFFGEAYGIQVYSTKNIGTDVELTLPFLTYDTLDEQQRRYIDEDLPFEQRNSSLE